MARKKPLMDRLGDAVQAAKREVETVTAKAERDVKRRVRTVATRVKNAAIKIEKATAARKPAARKPPSPGARLDQGIATVKRASRKAGAAVREAVAQKKRAPAKRAPARKTAPRTTAGTGTGKRAR